MRAAISRYKFGQYYKRVTGEIKVHPMKWLGGVLFVIAGKLLEHRLLQWTNNRFDEGANQVMPYIHDVLTESIAHPRLSIFAVLASYSIAMVVVAHLSAMRAGSERQVIPQAATLGQRLTTVPKAVPNASKRGVDGYRDSVTLHGPDGVDLLIYPSTENRYLCKFLNGSGSIVQRLQVNMVSRRSLDISRLAWRDPLSFHGMMGPTRTPTDPGEFSQEFNFSGEAAGGGLRIGDDLSSVLRWPSGDQSTIQRWRLGMQVIGASKEWFIDLCMRWTPGYSTLELMEYSDAVPPGNF